MPGMQKVLRGVVAYRKSPVQKDLVDQFKRIKDRPEPKAVFFTCMDSRMMATRFTQAQVGDMFMVRNSGNMIPHAASYGFAGAEVSVTTEPAALELACVRGGIKDVIVCGHSDCKAMNCLYDLKIDPKHHVHNDSPLEMWLRRHGYLTVDKFDRHLKDFKKPVKFLESFPSLTFDAYIDPEDKFHLKDKLSQINCLQQLDNICSHAIVQPLLEKNQLHLHAMWFDIYTGDVYYFSRKEKKFVVINEDSIEAIVGELSEK